MANALVRDAALQATAVSKRGVLERVFARMFEGLVYAQIWEDPEVDLAALELGPTSRVVTIASGGCNAMSYVVADPACVQAVDLNPAHVALLKLKLAAARHLPHHEAFGRSSPTPGLPRSCGCTGSSSPRAWSRRYAPTGTGATAPGGAGSGCSGAIFTPTASWAAPSSSGHAVCRLHGKRPQRLLDARDLAEQQRLFEDELAPVFESQFVRRLADLPLPISGSGSRRRSSKR